MNTTNCGNPEASLLAEPESLEAAKRRWDRLIGLESTVDGWGRLVYRTPTGCPIAMGELYEGPSGEFRIFLGQPVALQREWLEQVRPLSKGS